MHDAWETRETVLETAGRAGHAVSPSQLGRLHRASLVPAPKVRALGRGRGTESRYPLGTGARLVRVMEVHASERRLSYVGWRLWWEDGGAIPPPARGLLAELARSWDAQCERLAGVLAGDEAGEPRAVAAMDEFYAAAEGDRVMGVLGQARRNIGRERFATFLRVLAEVGTGRFAGYEADDHGVETAELVERALDLDRARSDHLAGHPPWLDGSTEGDFAALAQILASRSMLPVVEIDERELDSARVELRSLIAVITMIAPLLERLFGRAAFGFGMLGRAFGGQAPKTQALMLLGWLTLREEEGFRAGLQRIAAVLPQAEATVELDRVLTQLREAVPVLAPVLTDQRLVAAQLDREAASALNSEIAQLRQTNIDSFDAFFAAHPEVARWQAVLHDGG